MKWNETNQNKKFDMIPLKKSNNVEYLGIKTIKLFGLGRKCGIKMNNYSDFLFVIEE